MSTVALVMLPPPDEARVAMAAALGAFDPVGGLDELQQAVFDNIAEHVFGLDLDDQPLTPLTADELLARSPSISLRRQTVHLTVVLELIEHPLSTATALAVERHARALDVDLSLLRDGRELAAGHVALMYADLQRSSWYTAETIHESLHGRLWELMRSKLAYTGIAPDRAIARKWEALRDLPEGSWGREVAAFYERHHFPFPGERHGIYELGARHDFVHVLTGYDATPEGELDVFAFIASCMPDERGLVLLAVTLGIFQNDAIHRVAGRKVKMARTDTLAQSGAAARWAEAMQRGARCNVDVMGGIDHFALAPLPLDEVRRRFDVVTGPA